MEMSRRYNKGIMVTWRENGYVAEVWRSCGGGGCTHGEDFCRLISFPMGSSMISKEAVVKQG